MADFEVAIEGKGVVAAANELLAIPGLSGTLQPIDEKLKDPVEVVILTFILNIAATVAADRINEFIRKQQRSQSNNQIEYILFKSRDGKRYRIDFPLDEEQDVLEEIRKVLKDEDS